MSGTIEKIRVWYNERAKGVLERYGLPDKLFSRAIGMFFVISIIQLLSARHDELNAIDGWKDYVEAFPFVPKLLWILVGFVLMSLLHFFLPEKLHFLDHAVLMGGALLFGICLVWRSDNFYLGVAAAAVTVVFVTYAMGKFSEKGLEKLPDLGAGIIVFGTAAIIMVFVAVTTVCNELRFGTATFDMGIFVQMFYSMKEHLTAVTTCERQELGAISHFAVHSSFIYYLLAPIYALVPRGETLMACQAVLAVAGIIPLFMLARKHDFKGVPLVSICFVYLFYAGIILPCYYHFHENCFLPTLLMWLIYAMDQRKIVLFYIMSVLVCAVKEDAPLYVICIAFFFLFDEKSYKRFHGLIITALSIAYFFIITGWLAEYGDGQHMAATRFGNLTIDPEDGFTGIIRNVLVDPGYFFSLMVKESTMLFFMQTMLPLLFLPFMTKKIYRFLLIIPYVIMNLVVGSGYGYAANIGFQYIFGPSCLLIYMLLRNIEDMGKEKRNLLAAAAATVSVVTMFAMGSGYFSWYESYRDNAEKYRQADAAIASIPEDASVLSNTFLLPHAANRDEVYTLDNDSFTWEGEGREKEDARSMKNLEKYDFILMSVTDPKTDIAVPYLEEAGFTKYAYTDGFILIYVSPDYQFAE